MMKILFDDLEEAMYSSNEELSYWIDKTNGKTFFIGPETAEFLEDERYFEDEIENEATRQVLILLGEMESEEEFDKERYLEIETPSSDEDWKMRAEFNEDLENVEVREKLTNAMRGGKPFQRFKNILLDHPEIREKWFEFEKEKLRAYVQNWAEKEKIEIEYETYFFDF